MFYVHVPVDIPDRLMKHIIGKGGKRFKALRSEHKLSNIWYNADRGVVELWGPIEGLVMASIELENQLLEVKERFQESVTPTSVEDEYLELFLSDSVESEHVRMLIGKNGNGFKTMTRAFGVSFIWYDNDRHSIQVWGPSDALLDFEIHLSSMVHYTF